MGRIKKSATERHEATISPYIAGFISDVKKIPIHRLPEYLSTFPSDWPFPRGDLYHWIGVLNRFDDILGLFVKEYELDQGPQKRPFECSLLLNCASLQTDTSQTETPEVISETALKELGYTTEGDVELVDAILRFSRLLLDSCGNRSLYSSSEYLNHLLNSTSLALLKTTLRLTLCLAQRYYSSKSRVLSPHVLSGLLASHFNLSLDRLQRLADTFPRKHTPTQLSLGTPSKGKERTSDDKDLVNPADINAIVKSENIPEAIKREFSEIQMMYYEKASPAESVQRRIEATPASPASPTPVRRSSNLGPGNVARSNQSTATEEQPETPTRSARLDGAGSSNGPKTLHIPSAEIASKSVWQVLAEHTVELPSEYHNEFLQRVRVASAFLDSKQAVDNLVSVRLLSIANLAYVYSETSFAQKISQPDSEEPRAYQLAQQLTDLLQPPNYGPDHVSQELTIHALAVLEALCKCKHKVGDVVKALNIGVSHGILFFILRKVITSLEANIQGPEENAWREGVFTLVMSLSSANPHHRSGDQMVAAGLMGVLVEMLQIRNEEAEKYYPNILNFFDNFIHNGVRDSFQSLVNAHGLEAIANLTVFVVESSPDDAPQGKGIPDQFRTKMIDYKLSFFRQQTLRLLFKFITHLFHHNTAQERLLRNLIDSPQLLSALKIVVGNAKIFGSNIWVGAINIVSAFIHNEPTSYNVIAEAGLSRGIIEAITQTPIENGKQVAGPEGILPVGETMRDIPTVFGAICLNEAGLKMFQQSNALETYLSIFTSLDHVKALEDDNDGASLIGAGLDELVRHHPALKDQMPGAILHMARQVVESCQRRASQDGVGTKLWYQGKPGQEFVAGGRKALGGVSSDDLHRAKTASSTDFSSAAEGESDEQAAGNLEASDLESDALVNDRTSGRSTSDVISVVCKFLESYLGNATMMNEFCAAGGVELLLDLAVCACNPHNFHELSTYEELTKVFRHIAEHKPHMVLPVLAERARNAIYVLKPLIDFKRDRSYFEGFTSPEADASDDEYLRRQRNGTYIAKTMVSVQVLCNILAEILQAPNYHHHRTGQYNALFYQVNLTDLYVELVDRLGKLHAVCIWEEIMMQNLMPEDWKKKTKVHGKVYDTAEANNVMGQVSTAPSRNEISLTTRDANTGDTPEQSETKKDFDQVHSAAYKNTEILRYLLSQIPTGIASLFQALGKGLLVKQRLVDGPALSYSRQNANVVAEALARAAIEQIEWPTPVHTNQPNDRLAFEIVVLSSTIQTLADKKHGRNGFQSEILTLVLQKFYLQGGFKILNARLEMYCERLREHVKQSSKPRTTTSSLPMAAIGLILDFYVKVVNYKSLHDSPQTAVLSERAIHDPKHADYFEPSQFAIELRHAVLPTVSQIWSDDIIEQLDGTCVKSVIGILRLSLEGDGEHKALRTSVNRHVQSEMLKWKPDSPQNLRTLVEAGASRDLAIEAMFRCNDQLSSAKEYCNVRKTGNAPRIPPPQSALEQTSERPIRVASSQPASTDTVRPAELARVPSVEMQDADEPEASRDTDDVMSDADEDEGGSGRRVLPAELISGLLNGQSDDFRGLLSSMPSNRRQPAPAKEVDTGEKYVTVENLNDIRGGLRDALIDRCLSVLSTHPGITFDLADLITAAVPKQGDSVPMKTSIGESLVMALYSLRPDDGVQPEAKKIASYAHLLAIIMQEKDFFEATLDCLKSHFELLVDYLKVSPSTKFEDVAPYMSNVLLVVERILAEDETPEVVEWKQPPADQSLQELEPVQLRIPIIALEEKEVVFQTILEILPRVSKDEVLALSLVRTMVILTRQRSLAKRLGEKQNLGRLFLMVKQLAGITNDRLQGAILLVLRHIIEDDDVIRQIMRTEIRSTFANARGQRTIDSTVYVRNLYHLVLRSPELFVEVTNEIVQLAKWEPIQRPQPLKLKDILAKPEETVSDAPKADVVAEDAAKSIEKPEQATPRQPLERTKTAELKTPMVENPDGVIQFLLKELSSYRDVEDKEPAAATTTAQPSSTEQNPDVDMNDATPTPGSEQPATTQAKADKPDKPEFKADQNPIYIYRCFILQCLVELLASYNRTKVEFINFSPKADYNVFTPSKPRSGLLNYLLNSLIPVGTLNHQDDVPHRKRLATSNWAISVVVALCTKTSESAQASGRSPPPEEPDLVYVRKFVLEQALKAYRDAMSSTEPLDQRYSRLLCLGDLFNRMLTSKPSSGNNAFNMDMLIASQKQLGRLMYEKNFVSTLTSSLADIDLNFPNSKRAVKYILRPLKWLTNVAVDLSTSSDSSLPGTTDEDEISSATSISDDDDDREETPDLFRNSTLGQFEPGNEDDDSESDGEEDEDDYYGEEYDEEMEYEDEEHDHDHGDVVSDDDEELGDMGEIEGMPGDVDMNNLEIVMTGSEDSDDDDDEDDDDDDDDDHDHDDGVEIIDELTGDNENASGEEGDEDEGDWEDEDDDHYDEVGDFLGHGSPHGGHLDAMRQAMDDEHSELLEQLQDGGAGLVAGLEMGPGGEYYVDNGEEEDDDEEEEDEIDYDDEDIIYEPEMDGDEEDEAMNWGWDEPMPHARHHTHARIPPDPWNGLAREDRLGGPYRSHRGGPRNDDGTNPLLQRLDGQPDNGRSREGLPAVGEVIVGGNGGHFAVRRGAGGAEIPSFVNDLMRMVTTGPRGAAPQGWRLVPAGDGFPGGFSPFVIQPGPRGMPFPDLMQPPPFIAGGGIGTLLQNLRNGREAHHAHRPAHSDPGSAVAFTPTLSVNRWQDEARILFGSGYIDRSLKVVNSILRLLTPPAMEAKRLRDQEAAEIEAANKKIKEEQAKKAEAEKKEREEKEKKDREEEEARKAEEAAVAAREAVQNQEAEGESEMEGIEEAQPVVEPAAVPEQPSQRVTTLLRGREVDITNLGIDAEYLDALPEEMREEVVMSQLQERRSEAVASGQQPSEISPEFLQALPPEIQQELLRQEAQDRRRQEREQQRRQAAASGAAAAPQPEDMNNADFMAMLDPVLRQSVLREADDNTFAALPAALQAEARALGRELGRERREMLATRTGAERHQVGDRQEPQAEAVSKARRPVGQILDKSGVATMLRLMFVALQGSARSTMHGVLSDICKNTQNRAEVISVLLSILQDASVDGGALEKSFAQLTIRAKQAGVPKTPQPLKRTLNGSQIDTPTTDISPLMVVKHCIFTLTLLADNNPRVSSFFLSEHETITSQRAKSAKKGKGKDNKASKFPLNALLTLLDRKAIIENVAVMEHLAHLLVKVTEPLKILLRKAKEAEKEKEKKAEAAPQEATTTGAPSTDVAMTEGATAEPEAGVTEEPKAEEQPKPEANKKKERELTPPDVPEETLCLVVNIIAARECPSATFKFTLEIINHLSAIPGARDVFGKELVRRAQDLGAQVLEDLAQLPGQINNANTATEIQGMALASFSPASSHQNKLLRVLLALDYVFDPKRAPDRPVAPSADRLPQKAKDDLVSSLYENQEFVKLWSNLSDCLTAIRERDNMSNVATILQPLIESFMVVCKNISVKDKDKEVAMITSQDWTSGPPSADNGIEALFYSFTEEHRKILNDLVRHNPKLLSGTFDVLAKNSKVLEFDNKRNFFNKKLHSRTAEERIPHPTLQLNIRRSDVFLDSFKSLYYKKANEIKYGKLNIRFHGEEGVDAGGVTREWFGALSRQMFNPDYALFNPVASDRTTFHPNPLSEINEQHLTFFKFIGRIIGKALYEGRVLDCHFSRAVYKRILGKPVSLKDMETLDLDYYKSLLWILENDITDVTFESFCIEVDRFGSKETVDLIPNGRDIPVTEENKKEYVNLVVQQRLTKSVEEQLKHFLIGFREIVPGELISIFNEQELELLISGLPDIDVDDWKNNTEYHNYNQTSPQVQWFWRAVRGFDKEEKAKLLQFVTGTSKVPLNGFKELEGMNGFSRFNIHRDFGSKERLPSSHTCFNQLDLPEYDSYEQLRKSLYTAMTAGSEYFGFA